MAVGDLVRKTEGTWGLYADRFMVDWDDVIFNTWPDVGVLTHITGRIGRKTTDSPEFKHMEEAEGPVWDAVNNAAGYDSAATAIVVDHAGYFAKYDRVKVPRTGEVLLITDVNTITNTLTVIRGFGTTAAAAIVDNDPLLIIDNAMPEGSGAPLQKLRDPSTKDNYTQIFKTVFGATGTTIASEQRGPKELDHQRMIATREHKLKLEYAALFGEKKKYLSGSEVIRTTAGLLSIIETNVYNVGGLLTETNFFKEFVPMALHRGSRRKLMLCSQTVLAVLNSWPHARIETVPETKSYGMNLKTLITPHGELVIAYDELLTGAVYGGYAVVVDVDNVKYRPLKGRDTKLIPNIQNPDEDAERDMLLTEAGFEFRGEETHAIMKGVTG